MKTLIILIVGLVIVAVLGTIFLGGDRTTPPMVQNVSTSTNEIATSTPLDLPLTVVPIEHASAILSWGDESIYIDPVGADALYNEQSQPDLILLTDIHGDHLSTSTLSGLMASGTSLIAPQAVADLLPEAILERTIVLENGATTTQKGFVIEAIPMYNLPEDDESRHVKGRGNGYVIERDDTRVYVAGDTSDIVEMRELEEIDLAFIPMNMPFTMSVESAADAVLDLAPRVVYPYHYRGQTGLGDVNRFKALVNAGNPDIIVVLENWYPNN